ncbi:hypothetical protein [Achromobacter sp. UMC71]|uniref:hypothetical protein n=1 Tax=Achromobacter sp. UMC71 TaxID=1862320 RepID=UPI001601D7A9|nr:hypothetical protein [Achromobacter sp. UMC71]
MYEPEIHVSNVYHLNRAKLERPPTDDVMGVLLRELSDARPPDQRDGMPIAECSGVSSKPPGQVQQAEGQGNLQIGTQDGGTQIAHGNHNVQIADFQLIVQLGLKPPPPTGLRGVAFRFRHVAMVGLLIIAFLC